MYWRKAENLEGQEKIREAIELYRSGLAAAECGGSGYGGPANYRWVVRSF